MREIKFRTYNNLAKRMEYDCWITPGGKVVEPDGEHYDFPLMQFTGLKDRHGKEIYEGDIVTIHRYKETEQITWGEAEFLAGPLALNTYESETLEVIGNIYENPELLS